MCPVRGLLEGKDAAGKGNRRRRRGHAGTPWPVQGADAVAACQPKAAELLLTILHNDMRAIVERYIAAQRKAKADAAKKKGGKR